MSSDASGEIELIESLIGAILPHNKHSVVVGPGDDAAVLATSGNRIAISVDTVTEGQDFSWHWPNGMQTSLRDVGWKLAAQNLSDINAMGALPTFALLSCTLDRYSRQRDPIDLIRGLNQALLSLGAAQVQVVGGDTGKGNEFSATLTIMGDFATAVTPSNGVALLRSGAKSGDVIYVAGSLGRAAAGLAILNSTLDLHEEHSDLIAAQLRPSPPIAAGPLATSVGVSCGIDVSDGLLMDSQRIASASQVNINLHTRSLTRFIKPLEPLAEELGLDAMNWVLAGGEDYALLITCPVEINLPQDFIPIGEVCEPDSASSTPRVFIDGSPSNLDGGWDPFSNPTS